VSASPLANRGCGVDTIEIARIERLVREATPDDLQKLFSPKELEEAGQGPGRFASLAGRFAAKEACCKLLPREIALGQIGPSDFSIHRDAYGAPTVVPSPEARAVLDRHFIANLRVSITHSSTDASAIAWADPKSLDVPWFGKLLYYLLPWRRWVVLENMRRVFGDTLDEAGMRRLAQAYYAHLGRFLREFVTLPFLSAAKRQAMVRVENVESPLNAHAQGKGILLLAGHFGNWEVATVEGIRQFPRYKELFHFVRRPLKPRWFNDFVTRRFRRSGFGTLSKRDSLDTILELLGQGAIIVYVFDQHAGPRDGVAVDFLGHPASTFKSLAILALNTGAPVIPASCWREPDGTHVLSFDDPLPLIESENISEAIRLNTRSYNDALGRMLLRHPDQWIWMHRRWKIAPPKPPAGKS
jgi:phosphopantetheine--protein transferase-like protein